LKKDTPFRFTEEYWEAIQKLKAIVTSSPILAALEQGRQFILEVDVSQYAVSIILYQTDSDQKD
jgi:hypothetical protein